MKLFKKKKRIKVGDYIKLPPIKERIREPK